MKRTLLLALLLALAAPVAAAKGADPAAEAKGKAAVAEEIAAYAAWCAEKGAKAEGLAAAAEASALDAKAARLAETKTALEALAEEAAGAAEAVAEQRKAVGPKIAKLYDRLGSMDHDAKEDVRFDDYLLAALAWEPSKGRFAKVQKAIDSGVSSNRADEAGRLLVRMKKLDADGAASGKYERLEVELATKGLLLLGSDEHALVGYVSLPKGWAKGKAYPVVVGAEGAGCGFAGYARGLATARGSRAAIVVTPITLSNTNTLEPAKYPCYPKALLDEWDGKRLEFDGPGVDALLDVVRKRFGGEEKVFVTGFSGGGNWCYWKLFHDPAHVRGASPACANFSGGGTEGAPGAGEGGGPPVLLMTGEKDEHRDHVFGKAPGIEGQTDFAQEKLAALGYTRVKRVMVPGAGHSSLHPQVWAFVDEVIGAK